MYFTSTSWYGEIKTYSNNLFSCRTCFRLFESVPYEIPTEIPNIAKCIFNSWTRNRLGEGSCRNKTSIKCVPRNHFTFFAVRAAGYVGWCTKRVRKDTVLHSCDRQLGYVEGKSERTYHQRNWVWKRAVLKRSLVCIKQNGQNSSWNLFN